MKAPFPWFGGKSRVADLVWARFGNVPNYVEPFFGSGAVLLERPHAPGIETVNDLDGFVSNVWRALRDHPEETARHATNPINECDLHARNVHLFNIRSEFSARLMGDPAFCDPMIAGWWLWGSACWIGSGFATGNGPWNTVDGVFCKTGDGNKKQLPHLGNAGQGVTKQLPHLGDAGRAFDPSDGLLEWFGCLSNRLRTVRVACGDWTRIMGDSVTIKQGVTGVFLDPPYIGTEDLYNAESKSIAKDVEAWCLANGGNKKLRIALCGHEGDYDLPNWDCVAWSRCGGYDSGSTTTRHSDRIWFSPSCLSVGLF